MGYFPIWFATQSPACSAERANYSVYFAACKPGSLDYLEKLSVHRYVLDKFDLDAKLLVFEQETEALSINQINRGCAIASSFFSSL